MRSFVLLLAPAALAASPLSAQTAPPAPASPPTPSTQAAPVPKPQTVKKTICRRVDEEETTGSRLGSAPKVCKTVEVPASGGNGNSDKAPSPQGNR